MCNILLLHENVIYCQFKNNKVASIQIIKD